MRPGDVIDGRFTVERLAGSGGMSTVYRAIDGQTGNTVALKLLSDVGEVERLRREARVLASLDHPGVVRHIASGSAPAPYLAMEWLEGEDLSVRLEREELTLADTVTLGQRIADALGAAHRLGVVHRDIKPSNIFLVGGSIDHAVLLDFGVARLEEATRTLTLHGAVIGTVGYMSPEQARGASAIDARADVFALGCVLYRCVTGMVAFDGDQPGVILAKLVVSERPRISEWAVGVPAALDQLVHRMLAPSPADRPADGAQVAMALGALGPVHQERPARRRDGAQPQREQRLVCLILATNPEPTKRAPDDTAVLAPVTARERRAISEVIEAHGGTMEMFPDRSMLIMISGAFAATDLAAQAARCAIALRDQLPSLSIALSLGHSDSSTKLPTASSIDQVDTLSRAAAAMGTIVVDDPSAHLLDLRFELDKRPEGTRLVRARGTEPGLRNLLGRPTPCVGREREQAQILAAIERAVADETPRAVLVVAAPGMGKTRLCHEVLQRVQGMKVWRAEADALSSGSAFMVLGALVRSAAAIAGGEPDEVRESKLRACVARYVRPGDVARLLTFLAVIADVPVAAPSTAQLEAARQDSTLMGDQLVRAWKELVRGACKAHPLLLVIDDLHWGDHPSARFIDAVLRGADQRLVVLALARPELHTVFPRLWVDRGVEELRIDGLSREAREQLVRHTLGNDVTAVLVDQLAERSEGNAFYLEELIRAVAEGRGDQLPESVLAMAEARFQRLDPAARNVLRAASIFGETFWRSAVQQLMTPQEWATTSPSLTELVEREVIAASPTSRFADEDELSFRHALIRDAAYASLADPDRARGHARAGEWLEAHGERDAVVLAQHFERGGDQVRARAHYKAAAEHAFEGNDLDSALARAEHAVRCGAQGKMLGELRLVQAEIKGWHGKPMEQLPLATEALANLPPGVPHAFRAAEQIAVASCRIANQEVLRKAADELCMLEPLGGKLTGGHMWPLARTVNQLALMGEAGHVQRLIARMEQLQRLPSNDGAIVACILFARAFAALFDLEPEHYVRDGDEMVRRFDDGGYHRYAALQRFHVPYACAAIGLYDEALAHAHEALAVNQRLELAIYAAGMKGQIGWLLAQRGEFEEAIRLGNEALAYSVSVGQKLMEGNVRCRLASIYYDAGQLDAAEHEARTAVELRGLAPTFRADAHARLARVLLAKQRTDEALASSTEGMRLGIPAGTVFGSHMAIWLAHLDALRAAGRAEDYERSLAEAKTWLRVRADRITDPARRRAFVENVQDHATVLAR